MRFVYTALMSLMVVTAMSSVGGAQQVLYPWEGKAWPKYDESVAHVVPVATVSRVEDLFSLAGGRVVEDGYGEPFLLGAATLDMREPSHAKVIFKMTNRTGKPVPFTEVMISDDALCTASLGQLSFPGVAARPAEGFHDPREFQPDEEVTIQIPVPPRCAKGSDLVAILVSVGRGPMPDGRPKTFLPATKEMFSRVLERLRVETIQTQRL